MDERRTNALPILLSLLLLLPCLYVGGYSAIVKPTVEVTPWSALQPGNHYRLGGQRAAQVFYPLEQLHRRVRPQDWAQRWPSGIPAYLCPTTP